MKRGFTKIFIVEIYSRTPEKTDRINKKEYTHINKIRTMNLMDMSDYKVSNKKLLRYTSF